MAKHPSNKMLYLLNEIYDDELREEIWLILSTLNKVDAENELCELRDEITNIRHERIIDKIIKIL